MPMTEVQRKHEENDIEKSTVGDINADRNEESEEGEKL